VSELKNSTQRVGLVIGGDVSATQWNESDYRRSVPMQEALLARASVLQYEQAVARIHELTTVLGDAKRAVESSKAKTK